MTARKLASYLGNTTALRDLAEHARQASELKRIVMEAAPVELVEASRIGFTSSGVLLIVTGNGAAASKLKQLGRRILARCRHYGMECNGMRVEVQADALPPDKPLKSKKGLTPAARAAIADALARARPGPVRDALERMARRAPVASEDALDDVEQHQHDGRHQRQLEDLPGERQPAPVARDQIGRKRRPDREQREHAEKPDDDQGADS